MKLDNCGILIIHLLITLYQKSVRNKVDDILKDEKYKRILYKGTADNQHYPPNHFLDFESIMYKHKFELNHLSLEIRSRTKDDSSGDSKKIKLTFDANSSSDIEANTGFNDISHLLAFLDLTIPLRKKNNDNNSRTMVSVPFVE